MPVMKLRRRKESYAHDKSGVWGQQLNLHRAPKRMLYLYCAVAFSNISAIGSGYDCDPVAALYLLHVNKLLRRRMMLWRFK